GVEIGGAEAARRRAAPVVHDFARAEVALLLEKHAGRRVWIDDDAGGVDALPTHEVDDVLAELVVAHAAEPAHAVAEAGEADREVRLGARRVAGVGVGEAQRAGLDRGEQDHGFAESDDVHAASHLGGAERASSLTRLTPSTGRSYDGFRSPEVSSACAPSRATAACSSTCSSQARRCRRGCAATCSTDA